MDKATPTPTPSPASADTRDIVLRLRDTPNWLYESYASWKYSVCKYSRAPFEAADEIERLRAEVERLAAQAAPTEEKRCACNDRPASGCPGEWEPGCDLGSNPKYVRVGQSPAQAPVQPVSLTDVLQAAAPAEIADAQAPVVQAVQAGELIEQEMAMLIRRLCSTTANDKTRAQAMEYLFKRGHASPLRAESEPAQAMDHPPLPEGVKARFKCEDCDGTGYTGDMIPGSEFQPPEPVGCTSCRFTGWWAECEAYSADQMHAYLDADRASSCAAQAAPFAKDSWQHAVDNQLVGFGRTSQEFANPHEALAWLAIVNMELGQSNVGAAQAAPRCVTCDGTGGVHRADGTWVGTCFCAEGKRAATTQAVRMLTREELNDVALSEQVGWGPGEYVEAVQRKFAEVNGLRIPADGKIGGV